MKSARLYTEIVRYIHSLADSDEYLRRSVMRRADFSRRRKLGFTDYVYLTVQNLKTSLQAGLNAFIDAQKNGEIEYSKQASFQRTAADQAGGISGTLPGCCYEILRKSRNSQLERLSIVWNRWHSIEPSLHRGACTALRCADKSGCAAGSGTRFLRI